MGLLICAGRAQTPDVRLRIDLIGTFASLDGGPGTFRLYDLLGHTSTFGLTTYFESGMRLYVTERLQRIPRDQSQDPFEEYYVEDQRIWRIGKQFLPFGNGHLLRENVLAARAETNLAFEGLNIAGAACDAGAGGERGLTARIGNRFGASVAIGEHFGIAPTSLDLVRRPEDTPGAAHGWGRVIGLDGTRRSGRFTLQGEIAWFNRGATASDPDATIADLSGTLRLDRHSSVTLGWTRSVLDRQDFYRLQTSFQLAPNRSIEPMLRMRNSSLYDFSLSLHLRL
jgi:hypothetical protein